MTMKNNTVMVGEGVGFERIRRIAEKNDTCPNCGRHEDDIRFERIRRITGYLVGTLDRFNNAKRAEVADRVKHGLSDQMEQL